LQDREAQGRHSRHLLEQTSQATARLMIYLRTILATAALVFSLTSYAGSVTNQFVRSLGNFQLENPNARLETWKTNDEVICKVTREPNTATVNGLKNGWFVFPENSTNVWVFDGRNLWLILETEKESNVSSRKDFENCPKQVQDALPEKIKAKYLKN
jgi:enamine deaminase RidA (YjgF/YER057c/UK114 family)